LTFKLIPFLAVSLHLQGYMPSTHRLPLSIQFPCDEMLVYDQGALIAVIAPSIACGTFADHRTFAMYLTD
jgi:hypothetical protein